ncbi:MAG: hypothetical protein MAG451_02681 [Anaerolineales bacterium]|nr:hypothetical protein [Anaerolineales bacterium]
MKLEGNYTFAAPRDEVWEAMLDPEVLSKALPGCEELEQVDDNEYKATLNIRIGPVQGRFKGSVSLSDLNPPESCHMEVSGQGAPGFVNGEGDASLEEQDGSTTMHYVGNVQVGGRVASVGQRLLDSTAKSLTRQGLESIDAQIQARRQPPEATEAEVKPEVKPELATPSQTEVAVTVAKDVAEDFVPPERRPVLIGALVVLVILYLLSRRGNAEH